MTVKIDIQEEAKIDNSLNKEAIPHDAQKPNWLRAKAPMSKEYWALEELVQKKKLNTVCDSAACPNKGECWKSGHLATMILGEICTRNCKYCNIAGGKPTPVDSDEPRRLGQMVADLKLKHIVVTSVTRDDLEDYGAAHWIECVKEMRKASPTTSVEILTPDFRGNEDLIDSVADSKPDVFNHNLETVPRLFKTVRGGANYFLSLRLLQRVKQRHPDIFTKSGMMVGLGETREEVLQVMDDLRAAGVDFLTIGQYLRPTEEHYPVMEYITPSQFEEYERIAKRKGFLMVSSTPLTRSSYHADKFFQELKEKANK